MNPEIVNVPVDKPTKEELAFWEKVLHDHHLGIHRGRRNWIDYGCQYFDCDPDNEDDYSEESEA